jgi:hypothetical protein
MAGFWQRRLREGAHMQQILLDGAVQADRTGCECWGNLLEHLDRLAAAENKVLTAVRFDGVDQPSFRDPAAAALPLGALAVVEAETASPGELLENSVNEAIAAAGSLAAGATRLGDAFRGFDVSHANQDLQELAQGLGTLVAIAHAISEIVGTSLDAVTCDGQTGSSMVAALSTQADELIAARETGDWITGADIIEYDLAPQLQRWPAIFEALRTASRSRR